MKKTIKEELKDLITDAIKKAQKAKRLPRFRIPEVSVGYPTDEREGFGDYASPVTLQIAKAVDKKPLEIIEIISGFLEKAPFIGKIEGVEPGFMNIFLAPDWLKSQVNLIVSEGEDYGRIELGNHREIQVEFISANPTGPITMGNGRNAFAGDTLANVLEYADFHVSREYYINDSGSQVYLLGKSVLAKYLIQKGKSIIYPKEFYQGKYIDDLAKELTHQISEIGKLNEADLRRKRVFEKVTRSAVDRIIEQTQDFVEKKLQINFDVWFRESDLHKNKEVDAVINKLKKKGLTYEKNGSLWFKSKQFGDDKDRVLVKRTGEKTYFVADIAYHVNKFQRKFYKVIDFWGADHHSHKKRLITALKALGYRDFLDIEICQLVRLVEKGRETRMSKRAGKFVTLEELIGAISLPVTRFFFLLKALSSQMEFDLDLARNTTEHNPVFYVQYAHARMESLLRRAKQEGMLERPGFEVQNPNVSLITEKKELDLVRHLVKFPEVICEVAKTYAVQKLPYYAIDLASLFHSFYKDFRVVDKANPELSRARIQFILAARTVLKNVLKIMGIAAPEVM